jgi:membrane associated rhomboid family serine protease
MHFSITTTIIIITVLVSLGGFSNHKIIDDLIFYPPAVTKQNQWYRFFTCGLIHADFIHLIFNMFVLYSFGDLVEGAFTQLFGPAGKWIYLGMYVSALLFSILPTYFKNRNNYSYRSLGASGAVSAVIFAALILEPAGQISFYFIPMRNFIFAPLYLFFTAYMDRRGGGNINHSAHLWGSLYGLAFTIIACQLVGYPIVQIAIQQVQDYLSSLWHKR